jgi:TPP-dependent pyruvate/acetoin dehydrogenase alpha subunit
MADPQLYRSQEEVERWKERDPIPGFIGQLRDQGLLSDTDLSEIERAVAAEISAAVEFAEASPWESVEDLAKYVTAR